jgi:hypothetical protein
MTNVIILKGERNSGKTITLRDHLPLLFEMLPRQRVFHWKGIRILVHNKSIHENKDWQRTINAIIGGRYDIYVVAAWSDHLVGTSIHIRSTVEAILTESPGEYQFHGVLTEVVGPLSRLADHERSAKAIKGVIEGLI